MAKKTWAEQWGSSPVNYNRSDEEMAKELKKIRQDTARRVKALKRGRFYSYAVHSYEEKLKETYLFGNLPDLEGMKHNQLERELRIHHEFWAAKTSTAKGAREVIVEQSENLFGKNKRSRPKHILSKDEAKAVWDLHDEFYNMYKESTAKFDSYRVQRVIGTIMENRNFTPGDLVKSLTSIRKVMEEDFNSLSPMSPEEITDRYNEVFSGYGNDFDF